MSTARFGFGRGRAAGVAWGMALAWAIGWMTLPAAAQDGELVWARSMGGTSGDEGFGIAVDDAGNVYTTGYFQGTVDFDPGPGTFNLISAGNDDIFVQKLDSDGIFIWARSMGGADFDEGNAITVDAAGNVYITGSFRGTADFDPGPQTFNLASMGNDDIFVVKLNIDGNFVWARSMGNTANAQSYGIAVDEAGNVYTTGRFRDTVDFDPGLGAFNLNSAGGTDIFVQKLDSDGNFVWARSMGGTDFDQGAGITVDMAGYVYTTGSFQGTANFDPGPGALNLISAGGFEIFVQKLDSDGNVVWARSIGGSSDNQGLGIAVDAASNVYTTGFFQGTADFDPGPGAFNLTSAGNDDIFVQKLDRAGNLVWARSTGSAGDDRGQSIAVDAAGNVYTTGGFQGTADFDPGSGSFNLISAGIKDIFVQKLDGDGSFVWAQSIEGNGFDQGLGIAVDAEGNVHTTGGFEGTADFNPGPGSFNLTSAGTSDIFVQKLSGPLVHGDVNGDLLVDAVDVQLVINAVLGITIDPSYNADINGDFRVNAVDVQLVINAALGIAISGQIP